MAPPTFLQQGNIALILIGLVPFLTLSNVIVIYTSSYVKLEFDTLNVQ